MADLLRFQAALGILFVFTAFGMPTGGYQAMEAFLGE